MTTNNGTPAIRTLTLMLVLLLSAPLMLAQDGTTARRVKFERGRTSAVIKGKLKKGGEVTYVLGASQGQTLSAHISTSSRETVQFYISGPDESVTSFSGDDGEVITDWSGVLPMSGDYKIHVWVMGGAKANYTLEVMIR
jgi:hypothetical protein